MEGKGAEMAKDHLDLEEIKRRQQQLVEMKKVKQGQIEAPQVDLEAEKIVPHTVKEKRQNFWYHYKTLSEETQRIVKIYKIFTAVHRKRM